MNGDAVMREGDVLHLAEVEHAEDIRGAALTVMLRQQPAEPSTRARCDRPTWGLEQVAPMVTVTRGTPTEPATVEVTDPAGTTFCRSCVVEAQRAAEFEAALASRQRWAPFLA